MSSRKPDGKALAGGNDAPAAKPRRGWFRRKAGRDGSRPRAAPAARGAGRKSKRDDIVVMALGVTLGLICALFPWYIFFNQEKFGIRALTFEGAGDGFSAPGSVSLQPQRIGQTMNVADVPVMELDLLSTATLPDAGEQASAVPLEDQPFPADDPEYELVHVANGRAMIADEAGLWIVQVGSRLPDQSNVAAIEQRDGRWALVTTDERVVEISR